MAKASNKVEAMPHAQMIKVHQWSREGRAPGLAFGTPPPQTTGCRYPLW